MRRHFIIVVNDATAEQQNAVTNHFTNRNGIGYWHWYSDMWLLIDSTNFWNAETLRDKLNELLPANHKFVCEVRYPANWAAFGNPDTFPWLHNEWSK
jgi:hypothetical protein